MCDVSHFQGPEAYGSKLLFCLSGEFGVLRQVVLKCRVCVAEVGGEGAGGWRCIWSVIECRTDSVRAAVHSEPALVCFSRRAKRLGALLFCNVFRGFLFSGLWRTSRNLGKRVKVSSSLCGKRLWTTISRWAPFLLTPPPPPPPPLLYLVGTPLVLSHDLCTNETSVASLCLSVSLSRDTCTPALAHTRTYARARTHTHTLSLPLSHTHTESAKGSNHASGVQSSRQYPTQVPVFQCVWSHRVPAVTPAPAPLCCSCQATPWSRCGWGTWLTSVAPSPWATTCSTPPAGTSTTWSTAPSGPSITSATRRTPATVRVQSGYIPRLSACLSDLTAPFCWQLVLGGRSVLATRWSPRLTGRFSCRRLNRSAFTPSFTACLSACLSTCLRVCCSVVTGRFFCRWLKISTVGLPSRPSLSVVCLSACLGICRDWLVSCQWLDQYSRSAIVCLVWLFGLADFLTGFLSTLSVSRSGCLAWLSSLPDKHLVKHQIN